MPTIRAPARIIESLLRVHFARCPGDRSGAELPTTKSLAQGNCSLIRNVALLATVCLVVGCAPDQETDQAATDSVHAPASPAAADTVQPDSLRTAADTSWTAGVVASDRGDLEVATLLAVRTARHPDYERIAFEFDRLPNYKVEYIDRPVIACGSGDTVPLPGDAWLEVDLRPTNAHTEQGRPTIETRTFAPAYPNLLELRLTCDFEAQVTWVAGVRSPNRFRVTELRNPARLVVDIRRF